MKKKFMMIGGAVALTLALSGCGAWDRTVASVTGMAESCHDGVQYLQFASGVTVKYNPDGTVVKCK